MTGKATPSQEQAEHRRRIGNKYFMLKAAIIFFSHVSGVPAERHQPGFRESRSVLRSSLVLRTVD
jgi:hypothetical protein